MHMHAWTVHEVCAKPDHPYILSLIYVFKCSIEHLELSSEKKLGVLYEFVCLVTKTNLHLPILCLLVA